MTPSASEAALALQLRAMQPERRWVYQAEYPWHSDRGFRSDFAVWSRNTGAKPLLIEIDGAKRGKPGAHQRVDGIDRDCRRAAEAMMLGYRMLRVSSSMVRDGTALNVIERLLA